jgi:hypothetical protein
MQVSVIGFQSISLTSIVSINSNTGRKRRADDDKVAINFETNIDSSQGKITKVQIN